MKKVQETIATKPILWLAVMLGFLVDLMITTLIDTISSYIDPTLIPASSNGPFSTFATKLAITVWVLKIVSTGIGGLVAAWLAKYERMLHGALVGGVGLGLMIVGVVVYGVQYNGLDLLEQYLAVVAGGLFGLLSSRLPESRVKI